MRVSDKMNQNQVINNIQKTRSNIQTLQTQAATMKKVSKPSDDPIGAAKILENRTDLKNLNQYEKDIEHAKTFLETTESTLSQLNEAVVRAKELALQGATDTNGGLPREMIAEEISQIKSSILELSNRTSGERYLFGGYKTEAPPFSKDGSYRGDAAQIQIQNHRDQFMPMNLAGSQVFMGQELGFQQTIKRDWEVPKTLEELQAFKLDNIERQFDFEEMQQNEIEMRGPASIGRVERLQSEDQLGAADTNSGVNIFSMMADLELALRTNDKIGIQEALEPLDTAMNQINMARAEVGGRVSQMNATQEGLQKQILENRSQNSIIEDADAFETMSNLAKSDAALKGILETSGKMTQLSLMDFLR
jgi:flagellar hook-associated protein 3 FlgL